MNRLQRATFLVFTIIAPSSALAGDGPAPELETVYGHGYEQSKTYLMESRNFTIPVWGKTSDADHPAPTLLGHAQVALAITPVAFHNDGSKAPQSLTRFFVSYGSAQGQTVSANVPDEWMARATTPLIWAAKVSHLYSSTQSAPTGVMVQVPFGADEDVDACYDLLEQLNRLTAYQPKTVYKNPRAEFVADPMLEARLHFDGTYSFSIWYPEECKDIFGGETR